MTDKQDILNSLTLDDIKNLLKMKQQEKKKELSLEEEIEKMEEQVKVKRMMLKTKRKKVIKHKQKELFFDTLDKPEINFKKNHLLHKKFDRKTLVGYLNCKSINKEKQLINSLYENNFTKFNKHYYVFNEEWIKMNINEIVDTCISNIQRLYMSVNLYDIMGMDNMIRNQEYICDLTDKPYKKKIKEFLKDLI